MRFSPNPLHPALIRPADPLYRVDCLDRTQEALERRSQRVFPTLRTTRGVPAWRVGRSVDPPSTSGAPVIFSPTMLERKETEAPNNPPSIRDVVRRLKP